MAEVEVSTLDGPGSSPLLTLIGDFDAFNMGLVEEHLTPQDIGKMATRAGVKTVILSHLTPRPDSDDYTAWGEEVKKHFAGQVLIAKDLMEF